MPGNEVTIYLYVCLLNFIKLVEVPTDGTLNDASLKQLLRDVCITTGIEAKPVVLLVGDKISTEHMLTIAELMNEGNIPTITIMTSL